MADPTVRAEEIPRECWYFLNKRMLCCGPEASEAGCAIKCCVCNKRVDVNPFVRKVGKHLEHHPGPATTSAPWGHPGSIAR